MINFYKPLWLLGLLVLPFVYRWYKEQLKKKNKSAMIFSKLALLKKASVEKNLFWRKNIMIILLLCAIGFLLIGLSDPHIPLKNSKKGVNVVIALDVSGSMQEQDFSPNRLEAAKRNTVDLIDQLNSNDLIGVLSFGNGAATTSYLTNMKGRAKEKVKSIVIQAQSGFFGGCTGIGCETHIGIGLASAVDMATSIPNKKNVIVLLSDGANNGGAITPDEAITYAKTNNLQVYTIGMGSKKVDGYGNVLLDEILLKKIASSTGAEYFNAVNDDTLNHIYEQLSDKIKREKEEVSIKDLFILLTMICVGLITYFNYGRYSVLK